MEGRERGSVGRREPGAGGSSPKQSPRAHVHDAVLGAGGCSFLLSWVSLSTAFSHVLTLGLYF